MTAQSADAPVPPQLDAAAMFVPLLGVFTSDFERNSA
jgi:hypothetical protein